MKIFKFVLFFSFCCLLNLSANSNLVWNKEFPYLIDFIEIDENLIMVASEENFYIIERENGNIIFEKNIGCNIISGITPIDNNILISTYCGRIIMINKNGEILYEKKLDKLLTKPANCAEYIFIQSKEKLYRINFSNLEVIDFFESGSCNYFLKPFCLGDRFLIYQAFEKGGYANTYFLDIFENKVKHKNDFGFYKEPILFDNTVVFLSGLEKNLLIQTDLDGKILKKLDLKQKVLSFYKKNDNLLILSKEGISIYSMNLKLIEKLKIPLKEIPLNENSILFDNYVLSASLENIFIYNYIKNKIKKIPLSLKKDETQAFLAKIFYFGRNFIVVTYKNFLYYYNIDEL